MPRLNRIVRCWSVFAIIAFCCVSGCATTKRVLHTEIDDPAQLRSEIERLNEAMEECFRAADMSGVASFYADDGLLLSPSGRRVEGRDAIDAYWARFATGYVDLDWELTIEQLEGGGAVAYQRGRSTISRTSESGERTHSIVQFVLIWHREEDGTFRIAVDAYW